MDNPNVKPAVATAVAPTYIEGSADFLSVDLSGSLRTTGGGAGGGAATVANGADVAEGATTDAAVVSDVNGTVSGKLRGLVKIFADVWDSVNHRLKVDGSGVTQPVSNAGLTNVDVALSTRTKPADQQHVIIDTIPSTAVTGPLTDTQLRATAVPVSGTVSVTNFANPLPVTGTFFQGTQPVSGTVAVSNAGQAASAASVPVVLATDQSPVAVTPSNVALQHGDMWKLVGLMTEMLAEVKALRLIVTTVTGQSVETDNIDFSIQ